MEPVYNEKALLLGEYLVVADLHIGLERELSADGLRVPSQLDRMERRILGLLRSTGREKLVILGDLKHSIPLASWQEYREIPGFVERLSRHADVTLVKGNHDGGIEKITPGLRVTRELEIPGKALLLHGHAKPKDIGYDCLIMGHHHPCIEFRGGLGGRITESAWIRTRFKEEYQGGEVVIMPAFNDLIYGLPFNTKPAGELLGPFFKQGLVELDEARVYLLDGTYLGVIKDLRNASSQEGR